ncbi:hypothetical protein AMTR_s00075p00098150 [Amborella trichopoda]|uniref:Uncharacterized protein n=1 Tax=Amborella trichopoda TaxID=13333 RepID=W1P9I5_AMBTC|nr:hypothetical protein AMTR_s00075p00098150 [Amborella trichopoda]
MQHGGAWRQRVTRGALDSMLRAWWQRTTARREARSAAAYGSQRHAVVACGEKRAGQSHAMRDTRQ